MKLALVTVLAGTAAAFAPSPNAARSSVATQMAFESELGAQPPLGFWDPLGVLDGASQKKFDRFRSNEIKHGRIAMLAIAGHHVTSSGFRISGDIDFSGTSFDSIPSGLAAFGKMPAGGLVQIILFVGFLELFVMKDVTGLSEFPGDYRNGFDFGWDKWSEETKLQKRAIELNNGRAAMMGILALMVHEKLGDAYMLNSAFGHP